MYSPMNAKAAKGKLEKLMADPMYTAEIKYDGTCVKDHPEAYMGMVMEISAMEGTAKGKCRHTQC